jgi:uncharacterized protein (TIGR00369 family)
MTAYPPDRHLLRALRVSFDHADDGSRAWLPVVPELCAHDGSVRAGALTVLVDVIGGGLAAATARPDWIATADLTLHLTGAATTGVVEARAQVLRAGRTTVVLQVELFSAGNAIGLATMSFSVLPRRETNPAIEVVNTGGPTTMASAHSRLDAPLFECIGIETIDAARGIVELPVREWATNSMGALQGGVVGAVVEAATLAALIDPIDRSAPPLVVTDLQLTYLSFGRVGPLRTESQVLAHGRDHGVVRVSLYDTGAESRQMTVARAVATRPLAR